MEGCPSLPLSIKVQRVQSMEETLFAAPSYPRSSSWPQILTSVSTEPTDQLEFCSVSCMGTVSAKEPGKPYFCISYPSTPPLPIVETKHKPLVEVKV